MSRTVDELLDLRPGWDGYGAPTPSLDAIATCRMIHYSPMSSGGVMIELHVTGGSVEIDIEPDGRMSHVAVAIRK